MQCVEVSTGTCRTLPPPLVIGGSALCWAALHEKMTFKYSVEPMPLGMAPAKRAALPFATPAASVLPILVITDALLCRATCVLLPFSNECRSDRQIRFKFARAPLSINLSRDLVNGKE